MVLELQALRSSDRKRVLLAATIVAADGAHSARVKDLTSTGAKVACARPLAAGTDVVFKRGTLFVAARVAWSNRAGAGLEFYRPLPLAEVARSLVPAG